MNKELFLRNKDEVSKKINFYLLSYRGGLTLTEIMNNLIELTDKSEIQRSLALNTLRSFIDKKVLISHDGIFEINYTQNENKKDEINDIKYCNKCSELLRKTLELDDFSIDEESYFCSLDGNELVKEENSSLILKPIFCKKR